MTKKKHLNQRQHQRIAANQDRRLARAQTKASKPELDSDLLAEAEHGLVISRFGQHADIEDSSGQIFRCNIRRTVNSLVTGDKVVFRRTKVPGGGPEGVVEAVAERE